MKQKLIELALPLPEIKEQAAHEKPICLGHSPLPDPGDLR